VFPQLRPTRNRRLRPRHRFPRCQRSRRTRSSRSTQSASCRATRAPCGRVGDGSDRTCSCTTCLRLSRADPDCHAGARNREHCSQCCDVTTRRRATAAPSSDGWLRPEFQAVDGQVDHAVVVRWVQECAGPDVRLLEAAVVGVGVDFGLQGCETAAAQE